LSFRVARPLIVLLTAILLTVSLAPDAALAGPGAETIAGQLIIFGPPAQGVLDAATPSATYTFTARAGQPISLRAAAISGNLTLDLALSGPDGGGLARAVPAAHNPAALFVDAFIPPADGTYYVTATALHGSAGAYELALLAGYAELAVLDDFSNVSDTLHLDWTPFVSVDAAADVVNGALGIQVINEGRLGMFEPDQWAAYGDFYIQADFTIEDSPGYHEYGFALRNAPGASSFYAVMFSSEGDWALFFYNGAWTVVQDWTASPAINGADRAPRIGVFVQGSTFRVFFNDQPVGVVTDVQFFAQEGGFGLVAATSPEDDGVLIAYVDNLAVTTPATLFGAMASLSSGSAAPTTP